MGLQEQQVSFKFAGGVETKMDSKAVPAARLLTLENGVFTRAISIKKRNGYARRSRAIDGSTALVTGARRLATRDSELLLFTDNRCYSAQNGADQWTDAGPLIAPTGYDRPAVTTGTAQTSPDHAASNGVRVYAWEDSLGGVWWTSTDASSGKVHRPPTQANAAGERPRCVAVGDVLHIYYAVPSLRRVCLVIVNPAAPAAASSEIILAEDLDTTNPVYDVCATSRADAPAVMVWHEHATTNVRVAYVTAAGAIGSPGTGHPVAASLPSLFTNSPLACAFVSGGGGDSDRVVVSYLHSTGPSGRVYSLSGGTIATAIGATSTTVSTTWAVALACARMALTVASGTAWVAYEVPIGIVASRYYCVVNSTPLDGSAGAEREIRSVRLAANAFAIGSDAFAVFMHDTTYFNVFVTLRLSDSAPAGRHRPGGAVANTRTHLPSAQGAGSVVTVALPYKVRVASTNNDQFQPSALCLVTMNFDDDDSHQTAQIGRGLYMAGACPQHYDGSKWTEQGFHVGPEFVAGTTSLSNTGSLTVSSTYQYKAWYEWTDAQGEIHRGPESVGLTVVTGVSDNEVQLALPTLRITRKDNVRICVARSLPGDTSRLWRVTSLDPTTAGAAANGYVANTLLDDSVIFVDRMSDATLQLQEPMYTTGGILSNDPAPLGSHVAAGRNRLFFTDAQAGNVVRFSQRVAAGFGLEVAPELQQDVMRVGGDITALAVMDDVVYAFEASAITAFTGDGPYDDGSSAAGNQVSGFSSSQLITSDVGCVDPASIVLAPQGLMFKSAKGIYLLSRSREVQYVGAPVEAYNGQTVRRATVLSDRTGAIFLTDSGLTLYFDTLFQQWSTFTNHEGLDACVVGGTYHYLREDSSVYRETPGVHSDAGQRIPLRLETAWLHLHEHLQGFQRFWTALILGTWTSPHQLVVQHRTDYEDSWTPPYYLDATGGTDPTGWITGADASPIGEDPVLGSVYGDGAYGDGPYGGTPSSRYQWRYGIHANGQAVQFRFEDFEKTGLAGASFELTELTIVGGVIAPAARPFSGSRST